MGAIALILLAFSTCARAPATVVRVVLHHGDGFGDVKDAIALAGPLGAAVVIDDPRVFDAYAYVAAPNDSVPVLRGQSEEARHELARHAVHVVRLPAGNELTQMIWGTGLYNLYVEEPGVPACEMAYANDLARGVICRRSDGTSHLRINPGFGTGAYGVVAPPTSNGRARVSRADLIEVLREAEVPVPEGILRARWGSAYYHAYYGNEGFEYLRGVAIAMATGSFKEQVAIFDFGRGQDPRDYLKFYTKRGWRVWRRKPKLSIIKLGPVAHDLYLALLDHVDLPITVTGTQSLLEAIRRDIPFVYEFIAWKMDINFGIAQVILTHFSGDERTYLLDWILGEGDRIASDEDLERSRREFVTAEHARGEVPILRHRAAVVALFADPARRALVRRLLARLREQFDLSERVRRCMDLLTAS